MTHTHEYKYWHAHEHEHDDNGKLRTTHTASHYHLYGQTHEHGDQSNMKPHSHQGKQYHPINDIDGPYHHHGIADHEEKEE